MIDCLYRIDYDDAEPMPEVEPEPEPEAEYETEPEPEPVPAEDDGWDFSFGSTKQSKRDKKRKKPPGVPLRLKEYGGNLDTQRLTTNALM